jgi:hypothetical protein
MLVHLAVAIPQRERSELKRGNARPLELEPFVLLHDRDEWCSGDINHAIGTVQVAVSTTVRRAANTNGAAPCTDAPKRSVLFNLPSKNPTDRLSGD